MKKIKLIYQKLKHLLFFHPISNTDEYQTYKKKAGKATLNYAKVGKGQPLVFIHGWANNWEGWIPIITYLKNSYTLYLLDLPGFGDSDDLEKYTVFKQAEIVSFFLRKLKRRPLAVVGLSMGSFIVGEIARSFSNSTKSVVLIGPVINEGNRNIAAKTIKLFLVGMRKTILSEIALKKMVETRMAAYLVSKYVNMYRFQRHLVDAYGMIGKKKMRKEAFVQMGISAASYNLKEAVKVSDLPMLLIYGKQDKVTSYSYAKKNLERNNPRVVCVGINHAGHVVPWENPKQVALAIDGFLSKYVKRREQEAKLT